MPRPTWLDKLSDEQAVYAAMVLDKAQKMGVPEQLALSIAYHESGMDPRKIGAAKEIGLMQVLPSTARGMGYTPGDMHDPEKNIEAGLKYLKSHLDAYGGAPEIAALAYNRGPGVANKFIAGEQDPAGEKYVKSVQALGGFPQNVERKEPSEVLESPGYSELEGKMREIEESSRAESQQQAQKMAGLGGGGAGALLGAKRLIGPAIAQKAGDVAQYLGQRAATGQIAAQMAARPQAATGVAEMAPLGGAPYYSEAQQTRIQQGTPGTGLTDARGTTGRARQEGYNIETAQQAARRESMGPLYEDLKRQGVVTSGPRKVLADMPGLTATESGVLFPRSAMPSAPPPPSTLEQVSQTFRGMMAPAGRLITRVLAPLNLYSAGTEGVALAQEFQKPRPDVVSMGASGLGALGGIASLFPPTAIPGALAATAGPEIRRVREQTQAESPGRLAVLESLQQPARRMDMSGMMRGYGATMPTP